MSRLHTFGCSITQGFALPDVVRAIVDDQGRALTESQLEQQGYHWSDIHRYEPSQYAWPQVLADRLGLPVSNHARRGACFQQIARQCAANLHSIQPGDTVIVMWTYFTRLSLQWPARTAVPFCNVAGATWNWRTVILGFNKWFGLERADQRTQARDQQISDYIQRSLEHTYLDPLGVYNRLYNNLVLQQITAQALESRGCRVLHLSVEPDTELDQLEEARLALPQTLREPYVIPDPQQWYTLTVDHLSCRVILDPSIPPAANDMHPSVEHHRRFAHHIQDLYFAHED